MKYCNDDDNGDYKKYLGSLHITSSPLMPMTILCGKYYSTLFTGGETGAQKY